MIGWRHRGNAVFQLPEMLGALGVFSVPTAAGVKTFQSDDEIPGTGQTLADLRAAGLSDSDLTAIVQQYVGAPSATSAPSIAVSNVNAQLVPRPSPSVAVPTSSLGSWFTESTLISGLPNWTLLAVGVVALTLFTGGRRR